MDFHEKQWMFMTFRGWEVSHPPPKLCAGLEGGTNCGAQDCGVQSGAVGLRLRRIHRPVVDDGGVCNQEPLRFCLLGWVLLHYRPVCRALPVRRHRGAIRVIARVFCIFEKRQKLSVGSGCPVRLIAAPYRTTPTALTCHGVASRLSADSAQT